MVLDPKIFAEVNPDIANLMSDSAFLYRIKIEFDKIITGEDQNKLLLYLICASSYTDFNLSAVITGSSSAGKSWLKNNVLKYFANVQSFTRITAAAPDRLGSSLDKKILDIEELRGIEAAQSSLRLMISEGNLKLLTTIVDDETGKLATTTINTVGRPTFITTATSAEIDSELLNRLFIISIDESREQTERIIKFEAQKYKVLGASSETEKPNDLYATTICQLSWISKVIIPYTDVLACKFPIPEGSELSVGPRRDFKKLLYLIGVSAWLHQAQRTIVVKAFISSNGEKKELPGERYVVASPIDFYIIWRIAGSGLLYTLFKLSERHKRVLECFDESDVLTVQQVAAKRGLSDNRTREFLESLTQKGYITKDISNKPYKYSRTKQKADFAGTIGEFVGSLQSFEENSLNAWLEENKFNVLQETKHDSYVDPLNGETVRLCANRTLQNAQTEQESSTISKIEPAESTKGSIEEPEASASPFPNVLFDTESTKVGSNKEANTGQSGVSLEEVASKTVKLERLTHDFQDKCVLCGFSGRMDWQITLHDGSSGLLCAECGCKLAEKMQEGE